MKYLIITLVMLTTQAYSYADAVNDLKNYFIEGSISSYKGNCPCPYSVDIRGNKCGKKSAYSKRGGATIFCYQTDVPDEVAIAFIEKYSLRKPKQDKIVSNTESLNFCKNWKETQDNQIVTITITCIGNGEHLDSAGENSFDRIKKEFDKHYRYSDRFKGNEIQVTPTDISCTHKDGKYTCERSVDFKINLDANKEGVALHNKYNHDQKIRNGMTMKEVMDTFGSPHDVKNYGYNGEGTTTFVYYRAIQCKSVYCFVVFDDDKEVIGFDAFRQEYFLTF